jgi:hypothetical protein
LFISQQCSPVAFRRWLTPVTWQNQTLPSTTLCPPGTRQFHPNGCSHQQGMPAGTRGWCVRWFLAFDLYANFSGVPVPALPSPRPRHSTTDR